jgi:hypothetical protein
LAREKESWITEKYGSRGRRIMGTLHIFKDKPMRFTEKKAENG